MNMGLEKKDNFNEYNEEFVKSYKNIELKYNNLKL